IVLLGIALWQFLKFQSSGDADTTSAGYTHMIVSLLCFVAAIGCGVGWFLTKPKDSMDDISITKF
ncbi:MAG: hypothetical protein AB1489_11810, partial [Acidobacteriota bacterium]